MKDARLTREPVLRRILTLVGRDELQHQFAYELLALRIQRDSLECARVGRRDRFGIGLEVVSGIPIAEEQVAAIIDEQNRRLTGEPLRMVDWRQSCRSGVACIGG
jgi:hypothetical protein